MLESRFDKVAGLEAFFPCEFCKTFKETFFYRTAPVAATDYSGLCNFVSNLTGHPLSRRITSTLYEFN